MLKDARSNIKKMYGFSLIELMLALTISMAVISMISTIYLAAQKNFSLQSELSDIHENAYIAIELLNSDIRKAGYIGCAKLTEDFPLKNFFQYGMNLKNKISSTQNEISVRHAGRHHANLIEPMQDYSKLSVTAQPRFSEGDILIISDCTAAEIFKVGHVFNTKEIQQITPSEPLSNLYDKNAEVSQFEVNTYFIGETDRQRRSGEPIFALFKKDIHDQKSELVEGVNAMNIKLVENGVSMMLTISSSQDASKLSKRWDNYITLRE